MATLDVNGTTIGYDTVDGDGVPVLLLHGTTMNRTAWDMPVAALPDHVRPPLVTIDFPGSGESSMPAAPLTVDDLVDQAIAVMDGLGHARFHVAGYSLGAVIAAATAAAAADRVASVTLLCGWTVADERMRFTFDLWRRLIEASPDLFMRYAVADGFTAEAIAGLAPMLDDVIALGASTLAPGSAAHLELDISLDISDRVASITAPTLVIGAEDDRWVDVRHSRTLAEQIPGARLEVLAAGHLVIQERAGDVATLLASQLTR
jgi:3-oxoadipate enol-lactonase